MKEFSDFEIGYLAALIDGEGCVYLYTTKHRSSLNPHIVPAIAIANTNRMFLEKAKRILETGNIYLEKEARGNQKAKYRLYVHGTEKIHSILKQVLDHLVVQRSRAKAVLDYCESRLKNGGPRFRPYQPEDLLLLKEFRDLQDREGRWRSLRRGPRDDEKLALLKAVVQTNCKAEGEERWDVRARRWPKNTV